MNCREAAASILFGLFSLLFFSGAAFPGDWEEGSLNFSIWNRSYMYGKGLSVSDSYENLFRLDLTQKLANYGTISLWADGLLSDQGRNISQFRLAWDGIHYRQWDLQLTLGDKYYQYTNWNSRFINTFHPYIYFRGASFQLSRDRLKMDFWAGKSARLAGLLGTSYHIGEQTQAGFKARFDLHPQLFLGAGFIHAGRDEDFFPEAAFSDNRILLVDSEYRPYSWLRLLGEWLRSSASVEGEAGRRQGSSLVFGPLIETRKVAFEANYRYIGSDYRFISRASQIEQDEEGLFTTVRYYCRSFLTLFGSLDRYRDNVNRDPEKTTNRIFRLFSGFSLRKPKWPNLTARFEYARRNPSSSQAADRSHRITGIYLQVSRNWKKWYPYLRLRHRGTRDFIASERSLRSFTGQLGFRYSASRWSSYWMEGEWDQSSYETGETILKRKSVRLGGRRTISHALSLHAEAVYRRYGTTAVTERLELYLGVNCSLPNNMSLRVDVRNSSPWQNRDQGTTWLTVKINKQFDWGRPAVVAGRSPGRPVSGVGRIQGYIFLDNNRNGNHDSDERGLSGLEVRLEDGSTAVSDSEGKYEFRNVADGIHQISLEERKIPAFYYILGPTHAQVTVDARRTTDFHFVLTEGATLSGRVIDDKNRNKKLDPEEKGLADVLVILKPVTQSHSRGELDSLQNLILNTYTDSQGGFIFDNIIPGRYELVLDEESLPEGSRVSEPHPLKILLAPGQTDSKRLIFVSPRSVIIRQRDSH